MTGGQRRTLRPQAACRTAALGSHLQRHRRLRSRSRRPTTPVAIVIARSARPRPGGRSGSTARAPVLLAPGRVSPSSSSRCLHRWPRSPSPDRHCCTTCCSGRPRRPCGTWPPIRNCLGAQLGVLMVLHTWGQNLHHHPHVHCVVTGAGLSCNAQGIVEATPRWLSCRPGFFLPKARPQSRVPGEVLWPCCGRLLPRKVGSAAGPMRPSFHAKLADAAVRQGVVGVRQFAPFGGPERVLKCLARYTHRVAISNHRLVSLAEGRVTFRYKDYADDQQQKTMTLTATEEFLRRFVQHACCQAQGFVKVRHYGLLANRYRAERLRASRQLLLVVTVAAILAGTTRSLSTEAIEPVRVRCCPEVRQPTAGYDHGAEGWCGPSHAEYVVRRRSRSEREVKQRRAAGWRSGCAPSETWRGNRGPREDWKGRTRPVVVLGEVLAEIRTSRVQFGV